MRPTGYPRESCIAIIKKKKTKKILFLKKVIFNASYYFLENLKLNSAIARIRILKSTSTEYFFDNLIG